MKQYAKVVLFLVITYPVFSQSAADEQAISDLIGIMAEGWTEGSGEKFASVFASEHDYVVWNGYYFPRMSRQQNQLAHQQLFESVYKNTTMHFVIDKLRFIRPEVALVHVLGAAAPQGEKRPQDPAVLFSALVVKEKGQWSLQAFHNLDLEVFQDEQTRDGAPLPPALMYANWYKQEGQ